MAIYATWVWDDGYFFGGGVYHRGDGERSTICMIARLAS